MSAATLYLVLATLGFGVALSTNLQARRLGPLVAPYFLFAWVIGELAPHAILAHALMAVVFIASGALEQTTGVAALALTVASIALLARAHLRGIGAGEETQRALAQIGLRPRGDVSALHGFPLAFAFAHPRVERVTDIAYGESLPATRAAELARRHPPDGDEGGRQAPRAAADPRRRLDHRRQARAGAALMAHMAAEYGWVCVAVNYRLSPQATFPDHIVDVKRALRWIRAHIAEYGGDPSFVCVTGGSAGGHLTALTALSANDPRFQPGFEGVDTSVVAAVPFYGVYDFLDRQNIRGSAVDGAAAREAGVQTTPEQDPELWTR